LEENDEVVPDERSLPVLSPHLHLFEAVLFTQLSGRLHGQGFEPTIYALQHQVVPLTDALEDERR
jgi:hypothetical protein